MLKDSGFNQLCKGKHGYFLYNKNDTLVGKSMALYGEWSEPEVDLFQAICRSGDVVIEAGSNIGTLTVPLARIVGKEGRVYSFEVQRMVYQTLCANVALNSLDNVECFNVAVGAKEGVVLIPDNNYDRINNFGAFRANTHAEGREVPLKSLDQLLELKALQLIKADIECMEVDLVKGAVGLIMQHRPFLYMESEPRKESTTQLIQIFLDMEGYALFWHIPRLFNPDNYNGNTENVFGNYASFNLLAVPEKTDRLVDPAQFKLKPIDHAEHWPF